MDSDLENMSESYLWNVEIDPENMFGIIIF